MTSSSIESSSSEATPPRTRARIRARTRDNAPGKCARAHVRAHGMRLGQGPGLFIVIMITLDDVTAYGACMTEASRAGADVMVSVIVSKASVIVSKAHRHAPASSAHHA